MKKLRSNILVTALVLGISLFSCSSSNTELSSKENAPTAADSLKAYYDSIQQVEIADLQQFKQDSIESLGIKEYSIKKISGKHKYGGKTTIKYLSLMNLISDAHKYAEKEMWTKDKLTSTIEAYKARAKGGQILLEIERGTIDAANTEMFSVIVKDMNENEIYRKDLDSDIPEISSNNWWNVEGISIDQPIRTPFNVYVVDKLADEPFKFEVTSIKN